MKIAYSTQETPAAIADLKRQCGECDPRVVICFASTKYDPAALSRGLEAAFPNACVFGCSTAGELVSGHMLKGSVVAMFLDSQSIEGAACAVVPRLSSGSGMRSALEELGERFGVPAGQLDPEKYAGLVLIDGMSRAEERVVEELGDLSDLLFVGGSAGDDLHFERTHVFTGGQAWSDAALLAVLKVRNGFSVLKTQSFVATGKTLVATEVDRANRKVFRFNGQPAAAAYAEALGVSLEELPQAWIQRPLGLMAQGEPFVRSAQRVEDGALVFYCRIDEGSELEVLQSTDIVADTRAALQAGIVQLGAVSGLIGFNCILRTLELEAARRTAEYGALFADVPSIGFSTYGEAYLGHINQTATMLVLR